MKSMLSIFGMMSICLTTISANAQAPLLCAELFHNPFSGMEVLARSNFRVTSDVVSSIVNQSNVEPITHMRKILDSIFKPIKGASSIFVKGTDNKPYFLSYNSAVDSLKIKSGGDSTPEFYMQNFTPEKQVEFSLFYVSKMNVLSKTYEKISDSVSKLTVVTQTASRAEKIRDWQTNNHLPVNFQKIEIVFESVGQDWHSSRGSILKPLSVRISNSNISSLDAFLDLNTIEISIPTEVGLVRGDNGNWYISVP